MNWGNDFDLHVLDRRQQERERDTHTHTQTRAHSSKGCLLVWWDPARLVFFMWNKRGVDKRTNWNRNGR